MKIAFVSTITRYPWGGADTLWTHAAEAAAQRGDLLMIFVSAQVADHPRVAALAAAGALVLRRRGTPSRWAARLRRITRLRSAADGTLSALTRFQPAQVVFSLGGTYDLLEMRPVTDWLAKTGTAYQVIANWQQEQPEMSDEQRAIVCAQFAAARAINFVSSRNLAVTQRHLLDPLPNARVVQNPLRWQPSDVTPWPESTTARLATVARLEHVKGVHLMLHALKNLLSEFSDWHLDVYGRGPQEAYLRETAGYLGLGGHVEFRGYVPSLHTIWSSSQLLCSPAIDDGVPMTIPEAMLCERPVLATCVGGAEDWIEHGQTGLICPAPTVPLLAAALRAALACHGQWRQMGAAAAVAAHARYRPEHYRTLLA